MRTAVRLTATAALLRGLVACGGSRHATPTEVPAGLSEPSGCVVSGFLGGAADELSAREEKALVARIRSTLRRDPDVRTFAFVPRKLALARMRKRYPDLVNDLRVNPLPDAFQVVPRSGRAAAVRAKLASLPGVKAMASPPCGR